MQQHLLTVGGPRADLAGFTNEQIQCAVDRMALLGGGIVELTTGCFALADSIHLRSGVTLRGQGDATMLRKNAMKASAVVAGLGWGHHDLLVRQPETFRCGEGIHVSDEAAGGFYGVVSTLRARDGDVWQLTRPHAHDYHPRRRAVARTLFPLVSAVDVAGARLEDLLLEGNAAENDRLDGCRGGAFFAHRSRDLGIHHVTARNYHGDGFSFQTCDDLEFDGCVATDCTGWGFHPGSGSNRFRLRDFTARDNEGGGVFYCLRARHGCLEDGVIEGNGGPGISIGGRDSDNCNRRLTIRGNVGPAIAFRPLPAVDAPHRTRIEDCDLGPDCRDPEAAAEIDVQGEVDGTVIAGNRLVRAANRPAIRIAAEVGAVELRDNHCTPAEDAVADLRTGCNRAEPA